MRRFSYKAKDPKSKTVSGVIEARDEKMAVATLRQKGLVTFRLIPIQENIISASLGKVFNRVSLTDLVNFTRQLSTMVTAGLTIDDALVILRDQSSSAFSVIIDDILNSVEGGSSFAQALEKHPKQFSKVYVSLIKAGETAGVLDQVLLRLADNLEKQREFSGKVKGAMIYPVIVVVGMILVAIVMMVMVIPKLMELYKDFNAQLPTPTRILMNVSDFMVTYWWMGLILLFLGTYSFLMFRKTPFGRRYVDSMILKIPVFGNVIKQIALTEMTRTLGLLVSAGVSIVEAINIVSDSMGNVIFEDALKESAKQVEKGLPLAGSLSVYEEFPPIVPQMISVGEETGKLDEVLGKLSKYFETESDQMVKGLTTAIEPLIMIVLGIGVAFLVLSVILPIYNLTSQFN